MNKGKVLEEDSPSSFHHNAAMSDRCGTKSKIREIVGREERNMRLVCGGWSLWWWLWDPQEAGGVSGAAGGSCSSLHMCSRQLVGVPQERGPPRLGQDPRNNASPAGGHNAKILNLKTGQLPSLEVVQGMQSASKQSGGVLVPSTPCGIVLAIQPRCKLLADDQIERGTISLHWSYDERGERGGCRL